MMSALLFIIILLVSSFNFISTTTYSCDPSTSCGCSTSSTVVSTRIIGGELVPDHAWGWMTSLQLNNAHRCGASLITSEYAVTAAHCVYGLQDLISSFSILAGTNYLNDTNDTNVQRSSVSNIVIYPSYYSAYDVNDIAIIQFSPLNVTSESNLAFICLPKANVDPFEVGSNLIAIGWGSTSPTSVNISNALEQVTIQVVSSTSTACQNSDFTNDNAQFCAGVVTGGKDTCHGDSGGPLMAYVNNTWVLAGITSLGTGCAQSGHVGVYTRVSSFISFIDSTANLTVSVTTASTITGNEANVIDKSKLILILWFSFLMFLLFSY